MPEPPERLEVHSGRRCGLPELQSLAASRSLAPRYFGAADAPWLGRLLEERQRFVGHPRRLWRTRMTEPLGVSVAPPRLRVALGVLDRLARDRNVDRAHARRLREVVFLEAAKHPSRAAAFASARRIIGLEAEEIEARLFSDLPNERTLAPLPASVNTLELTLMCNDAIVAQIMQRALRVRIWARGQVRAVVRHAKLMGLLCNVRAGRAEEGFEMEVSGPYALFRHTRLYGAALASLVGRLARCDAYRLEAECVMTRDAELRRFVVCSGDPLRPARELDKFDSRVEEHFMRDFQRLALDWTIEREPQPVPTAEGLCFPDFALQRRNSDERYWLEIVGFWTPEYLAKKFAQLEHAQLQRLVLCVDESRQCTEGDFADIGHVVRYRRRVDVRAVLAIIDPELAKQLPACVGKAAVRRRSQPR